jgi:hypothetical protein
MCKCLDDYFACYFIERKAVSLLVGIVIGGGLFTFVFIYRDFDIEVALILGLMMFVIFTNLVYVGLSESYCKGPCNTCRNGCSSTSESQIYAMQR